MNRSAIAIIICLASMVLGYALRYPAEDRPPPVRELGALILGVSGVALVYVVFAALTP